MKFLIVLSLVISTIFLSSLGLYFNIKAIKSYAFFLPFIIFLLNIFVNKKGKFDLICYQLYFLCFIIFICDYYLFKDGIPILGILFFPILWFQILQHSNFSINRILQKILLSFFILNAITSFVEFYLKLNFFDRGFGIILNEDVQEGFRSTALLGHPLNNAYCMSIILGYIICSSINNALKFFCFLIGFASFLAFNARGITLLWAFIAFIYFVFIFFKENNSNNKFKYTIAFILFLCTAVYLVVFLKLGDRLLTDKIVDGSAQTRLDLGNSLVGLNKAELFFGNPKSLIDLLVKQKNGGFENSIIVLIYQYGFIFGGMIIYFLGKWIYVIIKDFDLLRKFILIASFVIAGNLNNGFFNLEGLYFFSVGSVFISKYSKYNFQ